MTENTKSSRAPRRKSEDAIGKKFGRFLILKLFRCDLRNGKRQALAICDCGTKKRVDIYAVIKGAIRSCGCLKFDTMSARNTTHGLSDTFEHRVWQGMRSRCRNPNTQSYARYGGRGISVCARWDDFSKFIEDVGKSPSSKHSLDRINNNGNYEPGNCRWATRIEQARNQSRTKVSMSDAMSILKLRSQGLSRKAISARMSVSVGNVDQVIYRLRSRECLCPKCGHSFRL